MARNSIGQFARKGSEKVEEPPTALTLIERRKRQYRLLAEDHSRREAVMRAEVRLERMSAAKKTTERL